MLRRVADELETALGEWWEEPLGVQAVADELNVSYEAALKRIQRGSLPNAGRPGAPLVRRCDLHGDGGPREAVSDVLDRVLGGRR